MNTTTEYLGTSTPIYFIGDSHTLVFDGIIIKNRSLDSIYHINSKFIPSIRSFNFTNEKGEINKDIIDTLLFLNLLDNSGKPKHLVNAIDNDKINIAKDIPVIQPLIIFSAGDIDCRTLLVRQLGNEIDFNLPYENIFTEKFDKIKNILKLKFVPYNIVAEAIIKLIKPLITGLVILKKAGFENIFLHSLPPPPKDDDDFSNANQYESNFLIRYKTTLLFNYLLEKSCLNHGIYFINNWDEVTDVNGLIDDYSLDKIHLNRKAALISINKLMDFLPSIIHQVKANNEYYLKLYQFNNSLDSKPVPNYEVIKSDCLYSDEILLNEIINSLIFTEDVGNKHLRFDWCGNSIKPFLNFDRIKAAIPTENTLELIRTLLYSKKASDVITNYVGSNYSVICCRILKSEISNSDEGIGPQSYHYDGNPPGIKRGLVYLTDVKEGCGPFEYIDHVSKMPTPIYGDKGSLLLFDANAVLHRATIPKLNNRIVLDLVLAPEIPNHKQLVIWPGMNHWPVNPFYFSIKNYLISPNINNNFIQSYLSF